MANLQAPHYEPHATDEGGEDEDEDEDEDEEEDEEDDDDDDLFGEGTPGKEDARDNTLPGDCSGAFLFTASWVTEL
jgi:hypothetical protein